MKGSDHWRNSSRLRCSIHAQNPSRRPRRVSSPSLTARAALPTWPIHEDDHPTTKLSSAFIVVLILHIVPWAAFRVSRHNAHRLTASAWPAPWPIRSSHRALRSVNPTSASARPRRGSHPDPVSRRKSTSRMAANAPQSGVRSGVSSLTGATSTASARPPS